MFHRPIPSSNPAHQYDGRTYLLEGGFEKILSAILAFAVALSACLVMSADSKTAALNIPTSGGAGVTSMDPSILGMYTNQVGGHGILIKPKDTMYILKHAEPTELDFYSECLPSIGAPLQPFVPEYYGCVDVHVSSVSACKAVDVSTPSDDRRKYLMMEDLAHEMIEPCILDLKIGLKQRSVRKFSDAKVNSKLLKSLNTTSHKLGFRLGGAQLHKSNDGVAFYNKYFGRQLDVEGTYMMLDSFFSSVDKSSREFLVTDFLDQLHALRAVLESLPGLRFWSGSLLLLYDSAQPNNGGILKMIDFVNFSQIDPSNGPDEEYMYGMSSLIEFLEGLRNDEPDASLALSRMGPLPDPRIQDSELAIQVEKFKESSS